MLLRVIPKIFYADLSVGRDLFLDGVGMQVLHDDGDFVVAGLDEAKVYLVQSAEYAAKDRPEIAIEVDDIDARYADILARRPDLLHPTYPAGGGIIRREYGSREFALLDSTTAGVVFRDWS